MSFSRDELERLVQSEVWFHSLNLGQGVVTKGQKSPAALAKELEALSLPDLREKTVLDIGAYDGFYSFEAERRGARRVVALDRHVWEYEARFTPEYLDECGKRKVAPEPPYQTEWLCWEWHPAELPGKRRFDLAHRALNSKVETLVADFMKTDPSDIGIFDVVFFLGVLYHMENPLQAMRQVAALTREVAIIETEAAVLPGYEHCAVCEFFESDELNGDPSNWWSPNEKAIQGLCRAAGFRRVQTVQGPPREIPSPSKPEATGFLDLFRRRPRQQDVPVQAKREVTRYRAILHAWK